MKDLLLSTLLLTLQNALIQYAPIIITGAVSSIGGWLFVKLRAIFAANEKLKNIEISKEFEQSVLREVLKAALYVEEKFASRVLKKGESLSTDKKSEALDILSKKFPDMNPSEIGRLVETVLPDVRSIFNSDNPTTLVK